MIILIYLILMKQKNFSVKSESIQDTVVEIFIA